VFVCTAPSPRGLPSEEMYAAAKAIGCDHVVRTDTVERAIDKARTDAMAEDAILVTGSLYIVGTARPYLRDALR
jgi:dihydrofolate synthase/folylpolyglutamate synthase